MSGGGWWRREDKMEGQDGRTRRKDKTEGRGGRTEAYTVVHCSCFLIPALLSSFHPWLAVPANLPPSIVFSPLALRTSPLSPPPNHRYHRIPRPRENKSSTNLSAYILQPTYHILHTACAHVRPCLSIGSPPTSSPRKTTIYSTSSSRRPPDLRPQWPWRTSPIAAPAVRVRPCSATGSTIRPRTRCSRRRRPSSRP